MITANSFEAVLASLGFTKNKRTFSRVFPEFNCEMKVDFSQKKLIYPLEIKGRERNNSFDAPENFVVFECVNRLLDKGYRPEHIELEKVWQLGHEQKGGRADICVSAPDGSMLFIIECKTYGKEFDKYLKKTLADGDQLFSYWQQERATKWLVLYASDFIDNKVIYKAPTINCSDYKSVLEGAKTDESILSYQAAYTKEQLYEVWRDTYSCKIYEDLIFSDDSRAYQIGIKPLLKKDLREFTPDDKIVNKFEEILRHNNVSDKENAFNRLVALFICKLVDESTKSENDEVEFQYKQGTDTYESLQDRLQRLHTQGMETFMREKIFYVPADYPEWLFTTYTGQHRQKAIEDLKEKIRILKFYSNNDFSFKDVHNEELFYQNGKILVEVVQLFEQYRIVYPSKHQFLGDLFEQLLNKGFKQNEGQFFTPMPITRFIWDCLPLERLMHLDKGTIYPKVIDYACGAGHFLTEAVEAINAFAETDEKTNLWVRDHIFGIEKDYRLARVSKISLFMNGAGDGNIIFGDGLENAPDKHIENESFDVLVANPPYSVASFKSHLQLKNNRLELLRYIGENGSEIEVLFVERIVQLLKPKGIAAVILPSSILSNDSASYIGARELILQNFLIRAIAQFGSKTFGATGTNTIVLFLEKYDEPPKRKDLVMDSVRAILNGDDLTDWIDQKIYESYLARTEVNEETYKAFINETAEISQLADDEYFKMYADTFELSTEVRNLRSSKPFLKKTEAEQNAELKRRFYSFTKSVEFDKLFYFALTYQQQTVVITAPSDNAKQKEFLGYDWSNRKGSEGIQIITPGGKLYDPANRKADGTLASAVRRSFDGVLPAFDAEQQEYSSVVSTKDMMDFSRVSFNKEIRLRVEEEIIQTKYPLIALGEVCTSLTAGGDVPQDNWTEQPTDINIIPIYSNGSGDKALYGYTNISRINKDSVTISARGTIGYTAVRKAPFYPAVRLIVATPDENKVKLKYLLEILTVLGFQRAGKTIPQLTVPMVREKRIPVPSISVQEEIIAACDKLDEEYNAARTSIEIYKSDIESCFHELDVADSHEQHRFNLSDRSKFSVSIGQRVLTSELIPSGKVPVFSANVFEPFGYVDKLLIEDFSQDSILWGIDGDWMVNYYPKDQVFYPTDHCGVLRVLTDEVNPRYMARILETEGKKLNFSRSYRASIDRIQGITFSAPAISLQNDVVAKVIDLEHKIADAEQKIKSLSGKKSEIIASYIN